MIKYELERTLDAYAVSEAMQRIYEIDEEEALELLMGEELRPLVSAEALKNDAPLLVRSDVKKYDRNDILTDLCNRDELEPGSYLILYSF